MKHKLVKGTHLSFSRSHVASGVVTGGSWTPEPICLTMPYFPKLQGSYVRLVTPSSLFLIKKIV